MAKQNSDHAIVKLARKRTATTDMLLRETRRNLGWRPPKRYARVLSKMAGRTLPRKIAGRTRPRT